MARSVVVRACAGALSGVAEQKMSRSWRPLRLTRAMRRRARTPIQSTVMKKAAAVAAAAAVSLPAAGVVRARGLCRHSLGAPCRSRSARSAC